MTPQDFHVGDLLQLRSDAHSKPSIKVLHVMDNRIILGDLEGHEITHWDAACIRSAMDGWGGRTGEWFHIPWLSDAVRLPIGA